MPESISLTSPESATAERSSPIDPFELGALGGANLIVERQISGRRVYFTEAGASAFDAMLNEGFEFWTDNRDGWLQTLVTSERRRLPGEER